MSLETETNETEGCLGCLLFMVYLIIFFALLRVLFWVLDSFLK